jgi:hypothetical protein
VGRFSLLLLCLHAARFLGKCSESRLL